MQSGLNDELLQITGNMIKAGDTGLTMTSISSSHLPVKEIRMRNEI